MVARSPDNELFRFSLGQALYEEGVLEEAAEHLEYCCRRKEQWMMPRILFGKILLQRGQSEQAREVLEQALALAVTQNHEAPEEELRGLLADLDQT